VTAGRRSRTRRSGADMDRTPKRGPAAGVPLSDRIFTLSRLTPVAACHALSGRA
jgi:hypothetical protein